MSRALIRCGVRLPVSVSTSTARIQIYLLQLSYLSSSSSNRHDTIFSDKPDSDGDMVSAAVSTLVHRRSKSRWSSLLSLFNPGGGGCLTSNQVSQILIRVRNNPRLALCFFQFTLRHSLSTPTLSSYSTIIHILARARLKSLARSLIKDAIRLFTNSDTCRPPEIFETLVRTYKACDSAPFVFDLIIEACLELNRMNPSVEIARMLRSRGISLRLSTCNALIDKVSRTIGCQSGYDLFKEIFCIEDDYQVEEDRDDTSSSAKKLLPIVQTFNGLMLAFYQNEQFNRVEELWTEIGKSTNCEPNVCSYNVLMAAYCDQDEVGKAWKLWEEMTTKGLTQDVVTYNTLIGGYCKLGDVNRGEELCREMVMCGIDPTRFTYQHLILGYCRIGGELRSAMLLYEDMQRRGFSPSSSVIDALVGRLCSVGKVFDAFNLFDAAASKSDDFEAKKTSYNHLIKGLCLEGKMKEALKLQAHMVGKGFRPDSETYYAFIDCCEKHGKPDVAELLRREMVTHHGEQIKATTG